MSKDSNIDSRIVFELHGPEETAELARKLSELVGTGDVLFLTGPIGAGKTQFARSLIQAKLQKAGLFEEVPSPTYTLVQTYRAGTLEICHADLYRIEYKHEIAELGLDEAFERTLCLIEWPEKLPVELRQFTWKLEFSLAEETENLRIANVYVADPANLRNLAELESGR
ncbi:MAG: tRNA (adenosine(37)-N6)-threonylcarbamoyltransferase complex ATPase subunit type 1 TsaE [Albidovulum sp.]|nr:tRNA (adenosine(37)-N6)-threonylcarbamoyltransferase complex ATPase subunit type 1 TsaE [Albidovulum sp.]MDE0306393.1 tRNA (adenosine(37)-N6)-threonylcarbamoyltransferase complex ATPase subunit type 1 TsaE [Albidovulum sp.]MDE0532205.1 tRNA (adenosine(37)-N6)-threonylcarbamoyltransferase complex ATPase subunit type 1 TsaE [Albidovulum sp.]